MAYCRACGAEIEFIKTKAFKTVPVNVEPVWIRPDHDGNSYVMKDGSVILGVMAGDADDDPDSNCIMAYVSHFATCPYGGKFRRRNSRP